MPKMSWKEYPALNVVVAAADATASAAAANAADVAANALAAPALPVAAADTGIATSPRSGVPPIKPETFEVLRAVELMTAKAMKQEIHEGLYIKTKYLNFTSQHITTEIILKEWESGNTCIRGNWTHTVQVRRLDPALAIHDNQLS